MRFVFVMDPPETVMPDKDTTFALMAEAQRRGHRVEHCLLHDVLLDGGRPCARIRHATTDARAPTPVALGAWDEIALSEVDAVFVRKDPPFDSNYLWAVLMLERLRGLTLVVNDPQGLRDANEKLYACHFPEHMPDTLVSSDKPRIKAFVDRVGGKAVIKPLDGAGGEGVMMLVAGDLNVNAIIEAQTNGSRRAAMVQKFLPEVRAGDKRILLLDGEPLGAILRVAAHDDVRSNIHVGGSVSPATLDDADRRIIAAVAPRLRADGLWFVGLDVIGGRLTEVNVTSPTGIQQMSRFAGKELSSTVIDWVEHRARALERGEA